VGTRHVDDAVTEALDERLEIHGDDRLILDDENVRRQLLGEFPARLREEAGGLVLGAVERLGHVRRRKALHGCEQEGDTRARRQLLEPREAFILLPGRNGRFHPRLGRLPHLEEDTVKSDAQVDPPVERSGIGKDRLQRRNGIGITAALAAREHTREPAQIGQMGSNRLGQGHEQPLFRCRQHTAAAVTARPPHAASAIMSKLSLSKKVPMGQEQIKIPSII
jgi:hypothetical protein